MAWASTDHVQGVDAVSTPNMAPATPMQTWQKPQHALESPGVLPSLSLGRGSSELKGTFVNLNAPHSNTHKPIPARCGVVVGASTPSKLHSRIQLEVQKEGSQLHKENLLSFSLPNFEKKYQDQGMATPLRNHTGPSSLHRVRAPAGYSKMLPAEMCASPQGQAIHPDTKGLHTGFKVLPDKSPMHTQKLFGVHALSDRCEPVVHNTKVNLKTDDSALLYSPLPGEVANNAYKLYSEMFPSTCATTAGSPSSVDADTGLCLSNPFLEHMDIMQLLPSALYEQKPLVRNRCEQNDARLEGGKKIKFSTFKEEVMSQSLLTVKQEPVFDEPCRIAAVVTTAGAAQEPLGHEDPCHMGSIDSTWKACQDLCSANAPKDLTVLNPSQVQLESLSTMPCSPNSSKAFDHPYAGACAGHGLVEVMSAQPSAGLKFFTSSAYVQMPKSTSTLFAGEPSVPLPSEPSINISNGGAWKTPLQGSSSADEDWGKFLALSATPVAANTTGMASMLPFQQRFKELQAFLKQCDEADQGECIQALRSFSAAARSGYAVDLETRAIRLSLEEGEEMKRMRLLNVLGRLSERSLDNAGATPQGPRLPAPGAAPTLEHVP
eukprot:c18628_g1_i2 orf=156-1967(-)